MRSLAATPEEARGLMSFHPFVMRVLQRCRIPPKDVPDVAQDVLLQLLPWWKGRCRAVEGGGGESDTGRGYVRVTAVHSACKHLRAGARRGEALAWEPDGLEASGCPGGVPPPVARSPEEEWLELEARAALQAEFDLGKLAGATRPSYWRVFYAHAIVGASVEQIAEAEQLPVSTIYGWLRNARRDLGAAIRRHRATTAPT